METITAPDVTEDDVLAGEKQITVRTRHGENKTITIKALNWRAALHVSALLGLGDHAGGTVAVLKEQKLTDEFLNQLAPAYLPMIAQVALQLSNGVDEAKNRMAEKTKPAAGSPPPASGISSPSSAS